MAWISEMGQVVNLLLMVFGFLILSAGLAFAMRSASVYAALSAVLGGVLLGGILYADIGVETASLAVASFAIVCGLVYLLFFCVFALWRLRAERRKRRAEIAKCLPYTLPQRENTYVRERLHTALNTPQLDEGEQQIAVCLGYARELLGKVQASPLSIGERLQTEEMGKILTLYKGKEDWTAREVCALNELCAVLLKLSAKYTV